VGLAAEIKQRNNVWCYFSKAKQSHELSFTANNYSVRSHVRLNSYWVVNLPLFTQSSSTRDDQIMFS